MGNGARSRYLSIRALPSNNPRPTPSNGPQTCSKSCRQNVADANADCQFAGSPIPECGVKSCNLDGSPGKGFKCEYIFNRKLDVSNDGRFNNDDVVGVLRAIDDPLGSATPGNPTADVVPDGKVDFDDSLEILRQLILANGPASVAPLTMTYNDDHEFKWGQENPTASSTSRAGMSTPSKVSDILNSVSRQTQTCEKTKFGHMVKGSAPDLEIDWGEGVEYNPDAVATASDYWNWAYYGNLLTAVIFVQPDAARGYFRYRENTGEELYVDYEKALRDDSTILFRFEDEIEMVRNAVAAMFDGSESSFSFHATDSTLVVGDTENWVRALGGHRIWSTGDVTYSPSTCSLSVDITVHIEDRYDFNPGQVDAYTGLPDDDNARFEALGWAQRFFSRGEVKRTETIELGCCGNADCSSNAECVCNKCITKCSSTTTSGGQGTTVFEVDMKKTSGTFVLQYNMLGVPDKLEAWHEGALIFTTGGLVSGKRTIPVSYGSQSAKSTIVTVQVSAPRGGTWWHVTLSCP